MKKKCKDLVRNAFKSRMKDIRTLYNAENQETESYGLSIDFVSAGTFDDQRKPYARYQLSWGGPAEEFRLYQSGRIEFWYLDWYDGAYVLVEGKDADIIRDIVLMGESWEQFQADRKEGEEIE